MDANIINWFEIPVVDFSRAKKFYESIMEIEMEEVEMGGNKMGFFPYEQGSGKVSGAIVKGEGYNPSSHGPLLYLNGGDDLNTILNRVAGANGKVVAPKFEIGPEIGFMAIFTDTENNRLALHSQG